MRKLFYLTMMLAGLAATTGCQDTWDSISRCEQRKNEFLFGPFMDPPVYSSLWDNAPRAPAYAPAYGAPAYAAPVYGAPACGCQPAPICQQPLTVPVTGG